MEQINTEQLLKKSKLVDSSNFRVDADFAANLRQELYENYILNKNQKIMNKLKNFFFKSRYGAYALLGVIALLVIGVGAFTFYNNQKPEVKQQIVLKANLAASEGIVEFKRDKATEWVIASLGDTLNQGDSIRTSENSKAVIEIDNGDALRLNALSEVKLDSTLSTNIVISLVKGETYSRVVKSDVNHYIVKSNEVEALALGTAYSVKKDSDKKCTITTYESKVKVTYGANKEEVPALNKLVVDMENSADVKLSELTEVEFKTDFVKWNQKKDEELGYTDSEANPPAVTISAPADGSQVTDAKITIKGFASDDTGVKKVMVNGNVYYSMNDQGKGFDPKTGEYVVDVDLQNGDNTITVKAYDIYWNVSEEKKIKVIKVSTTTPTPTTVSNTAEIYISAISSTPGSGKFTVKWVLNNLTSPNGFKIVKSTSANPVYPGNDYQYLDDANVRELTWTGVAPGTYHVRVCTYDGNGKCLKYSNDRTVLVAPSPTATPGNVTIPSLTATYVATNKVNLTWTVNGTWNDGFKVVWSETANPVYPGNDYHYFSNSNQRSDTVTGLTAGKTYHFRVCLYNGDCSTGYSTDKSVTIPAAPTAVPTSTPVPPTPTI
jgi:hypothetical protein